VDCHGRKRGNEENSSLVEAQQRQEEKFVLDIDATMPANIFKVFSNGV